MAEEKLVGRLNELIKMGDKVLATKYRKERVAGELVEESPFYQWQASCLSFLKTVFGADSTHFTLFEKGCKAFWLRETVQGQAILRAAKEDLEGGYLVKLETLVAADVFTDFLDMAEHLIENGYKDPAASLTGAVLEDGLRKIGKNKGVNFKNDDGINSLNQKLAENHVYNKIVQSQLQVWNNVRNKADHGEFEQYDLEQVRTMLIGVRQFLGQYLV